MCSWGGIKAPPNGGEITTNTNHFPNKNGRERQTWVRGDGIDIPISANNESFPLRSEERGCREKDQRMGEKGGWMMGERRRGTGAPQPYTRYNGKLSFIILYTGQALSRVSTVSYLPTSQAVPAWTISVWLDIRMFDLLTGGIHHLYADHAKNKGQEGMSWSKMWIKQRFGSLRPSLNYQHTRWIYRTVQSARLHRLCMALST